MALFAVLFVCEGNQCRSPAAEHVFGTQRARAQDPMLTAETLSAGTRAAEGFPIHPLTAQAMSQAGFTVPDHSSRRVLPAAVASADLILTADRGQRNEVAAMAEGAAPRTFTLLEFVALGALVRSENRAITPFELVAAAGRSRGPDWNNPGLDLSDPISGGADRHLAVFAEVADACTNLARLLLSSG